MGGSPAEHREHPFALQRGGLASVKGMRRGRRERRRGKTCKMPTSAGSRAWRILGSAGPPRASLTIGVSLIVLCQTAITDLQFNINQVGQPAGSL